MNIIFSDGINESSLGISLIIDDIPNQSSEKKFFIRVFDVDKEHTTGKRYYGNYFLDGKKSLVAKDGVNILYEISGGADAALFVVNPLTGALDFKEAPDFENPTDSNRDNMYEVSIKITNLTDADLFIPVVTGSAIIEVPESQTKAIEEINTYLVAPDLDSDMDGFPDATDNCPQVTNPKQEDTDGDGIGDLCDDSDGDGVLDLNDAFPNDAKETKDTDADGVGDNSDIFPNDPNESADTDNDGVGDNADVFPNDPKETTDTDADGVGDNSDVFPNDPNESADTDNDGVGDNADAFPDNAQESKDTDNDGIGDKTDNCPETFNPDQADRDNDGQGDTCDTVELNIMQAFTPNGDGFNDEWKVYNIENYPNSIIKVYSRWSDVVMESRGYRNDWNGTNKGSGRSLPSGPYLYVIDLEGNGNQVIKGWLYINK
jgi:gliding motility-associated-like protein